MKKENKKYYIQSVELMPLPGEDMFEIQKQILHDFKFGDLRHCDKVEFSLNDTKVTYTR